MKKYILWFVCFTISNIILRHVFNLGVVEYLGLATGIGFFAIWFNNID